jgi:hypothetical protein
MTVRLLHLTPAQEEAVIAAFEAVRRERGGDRLSGFRAAVATLEELLPADDRGAVALAAVVALLRYLKSPGPGAVDAAASAEWLRRLDREGDG